MKITLVALFALTLLSPLRKAFSEDVFRIEIGKSYEGYSNEDLKRRVWQLERAVYQLQNRVFQLEVQGEKPVAPKKQWTCMIQSFGTTYTSTMASRGASTAEVLKQCSEATNAIHCKQSSVKCDDE